MSMQFNLRPLRALAHPTRWRIVALLLDQPLCVSDLAAILDLRLSNLSNHLKLLRECGVLRCRDPLRFGQPFVMFRLRVCMAWMGVGGGFEWSSTHTCSAKARTAGSMPPPTDSTVPLALPSASICAICG